MCAKICIKRVSLLKYLLRELNYVFSLPRAGKKMHIILRNPSSNIDNVPSPVIRHYYCSIFVRNTNLFVL